MILGIDPGTRRVGVAIADRETHFARPLAVIEAERAEAQILELVAEHRVETVVVGKPVSLSGASGHAVDTYADFIASLRSHLPRSVEVVELDERLTSVIAERSLREAGMSSKQARGKVDAIAAAVTLQGYLDSTRNRL